MSVILRENKGSIRILRLNRPESRNALSRALLAELHKELIDLQSRDLKDLPRALVLTGEGDLAFCAGADLKERACMTQGEVWEFLDQFRESLGILESLPIPVIAGINGSAYGGGLEIALACDFRLVSSGAELGLTEARLGIIPGAGGTQRLPRIIGLARAKEMIYFGLKISATRAYEWNLVHRVIDANRFTEEVLQFAREIEKSAPISIAGVKQSINQGFSLALEEGLDLERNQYKRTIDSQDRVEALRAFQEKREPKFRGE